MPPATEGLTKIAEIVVPYDVDVTWDGGCRGSDIGAVLASEDSRGYADDTFGLQPGEVFELAFYLDTKGDIYVDADPHNADYEYRLSGDKLFAWQNSDWTECTSLKGPGDLPVARETAGVAWHSSISLSDKGFRACAESENPTAFVENPAVQTFFKAFDTCYANLSAPRDGHSVSVKFEKASP